MTEEQTTTAVQRYLDELAGDSPSRSVNRGLQLLAATLGDLSHRVSACHA
jgi:hypothetical protein